jgi:hypothetical protein
MPRSRAVRAVAIVAAVVLVAVGWYLGSPLFIRTTMDEPMPTAPAATPPFTPASSAIGSAATNAPARTALLVVLRKGQLQRVDSLHNGTGAVLLLAVDAKQYVRFEDVAITNAPDVHVYLSKERGGKWTDAAASYVGPLKATNGSFNYELPAPFDLAGFQSVVVWCRAFSVVVTWADLGPP